MLRGKSIVLPLSFTSNALTAILYPPLHRRDLLPKTGSARQLPRHYTKYVYVFMTGEHPCVLPNLVVSLSQLMRSICELPW